MKKILSLLFIFTICFILVGCDDNGPIPYNYNSSDAYNKIEELGSDQGFLIELSYFVDGPDMKRAYYDDDWDDYDDYDDYDEDDFNMTLTYGVKGDITYIAMNNVEIYIDYSDSSRIMVYYGMFDERTGAYTWQKEDVSSSSSTIDYYSGLSSVYTYLVPADTINNAVVKAKRSDVVCGRLCDKLTLIDSRDDFENPESPVDLYIDKELGICLKMGMTETEKGVTYTSGIECTRFEINPGIVLPNV